MQQKETTKEEMVKTLAVCYQQAWSSDDFFRLLTEHGVETYKENRQVEGIVINGTNVSLDSLGYSNETILSLDPMALSDEDLALIESFRNPAERGERELRASDIVPDFKQLEEELGMDKARDREEELDEIRGTEGEEKDMDKGLER
jgi:hypothetical protein